MSGLDWGVLLVTLLAVIIYGVIRSRGSRSMDDYLLAGQSLPWYHVGLSVMATQASAVTFLSAPGQGFTDGMRFVQFYFGLPLAMVVLSVTFVPIFHRLKVFTAYEFLENRFDTRVRTLTAGLFLLQRGLSTGLSIYAPAIVLSTLLGWNIYITNLIMGSIVLIYTVLGGTKAISHTHLQQMAVVTLGMALAGYLTVRMLPDNVGFVDALHVAGKAGRMNLIDLQFDPNSRYNIWSGLIGGFFLQLSYFGTDQSQVGRYLTGNSIGQSRLGLLMNGLLKVPMQFLIVLVGVLVFVFYQFNPSPLFFNQQETERLEQSPYAREYQLAQIKHQNLSAQRQRAVMDMQVALQADDEAAQEAAATMLRETDESLKAVKADVVGLIRKNNPVADTNDVNYIFLRFVLDYLPHGLIGLIIAVIFVASMGSIAAAYNSLASTTVVDVYRQLMKGESDAHYVQVSRWATIGWGIFCVIVALFANQFGSLIEAVNILGSLFYGVILGVFVVAFYVKSIGGRATFWAAVVAEGLVILSWYLNLTAFLWLNVIGCLAVVGIAWVLQKLFAR
ncbi:SSS sodium solute transporter superfamily [Fibrisoma limi BUZ 3]|uniref:SSS sodium solute transporter superfamily n=1 Tax=Fibrisoma limi BUZ 3 TaxID=1185876 RepID=I2GIK1_9BACT|nr:sodium:solute symporter [Fibrisoma limi]CCH53726.1 SSS sodium solute transporter superfamily [Fibrisoma limi BUZ 3]